MESNSNKRRPLNGKNTNSSNTSSQQASSRAHAAKTAVRKHSGSLEIIEGDASGLYTPDSKAPDDGSRPPSQAFQRPWSRSSMGSVPPRPDSSLSRRLATPTKQISLQAVKRKEESSEPFLPEVDFAALNLDKSYGRAWDLVSVNDDESSRVSTPKFDSESDNYAPQHATQLRLPRLHESEEATEQRHNSEILPDDTARPSSSSQAAAQSNVGREKDSTDNTHTVRSGEDAEADQNEDDDDDDDSDEEERKAPNELLMEFVECLMKKDYRNAEKLCKMILLYEPTNPEALKFQPVIEEKLRLDAAAEAEGANDEDEDDDDDDDDDEDDDDDDGDGDDSSSDDDDDDDSDDDDNEESIFRVMAEAVATNYYNQEPENGQGPPPPRRPDSGIDSDSER